MSFLEECRKAEDEDGVGKNKDKGKIKITAATASSPTYSDAFAKQLKKQQQQFDALMGKVLAMVTTLQSQNVQATSSCCQGNPSSRMRGRMPFHGNGGRGVTGGKGLPLHGRWRGQPQPQGPTPNKTLHIPSQEQGNVKTYTDNQCWQCGEMGHLKRSCPMLKGKGLLQGGNA